MIIIQENIRGEVKKFEENEKDIARLIQQIMLNLVDKKPFNITYM